MTLSGYFMLKSVSGQQGCRALTFALARLSCTQNGTKAKSEFDFYNSTASESYTAQPHISVRRPETNVGATDCTCSVNRGISTM